MAALLQEESGTEACAFSTYEFLHKVRAEDRERIVDRLNNRTIGDIERACALRRAAEARLLARKPDRRSGRDRRSGHDRRVRPDRPPSRGERRSGLERRSGHDRRQHATA